LDSSDDASHGKGAEIADPAREEHFPYAASVLAKIIVQLANDVCRCIACASL
jgi:hypothetical protein